MTELLKGFRFGMLLQLAVGPMCFLVFQTSTAYGFGSGEQIVLAVALVDALFIVLSGVGAAALLRREKVKAAVRWLGCLVLVVFGLNIGLDALDIRLLPSITLFSAVSGGSLFWQGFVLTASNPLTIVFWSGMFTAQMAQNHWSKRQLARFAAGCVLSTLTFLSAIAALGSVLSGFLPEIVIQILNIAVGALLVFYGFKLLLQKQETQQA